MKNPVRLFAIAVSYGLLLVSCEGPMGPAGKDVNESCKLCHNSSVVEEKVIQYEYALHYEGEAFEEGTRPGCAPCHSHQGFLYVVNNSTPATFELNTATGKYVNKYDIGSANAVLPGPISCFTCHQNLHSSYTDEDWYPLTSTSPVAMTMYGGAKTINFAKTSSNLCAKCHQPRPISKSSTSSDGNLIDYAVLTQNPSATFNQVALSYRTGVHYGTQGAMAAGVGGIEFTGSTPYTQSAHVTKASCAMCHMAEPSGLAGGHSFNAYDAYNKVDNFAGCNVAGCHSTMSKDNAYYKAATSAVATPPDNTGIPYLLAQLAAKINALGGGHDILQKDPDDGLYHGYLDIYDSSSNLTGYWKNPDLGNVPFPSLTNAQVGAIINYQLIARGSGKGIHNHPYMLALLKNTLAAW